MDGWITIGTKLDTKKFEQDLKNQERQLKDYEKEAERLTKTKIKAEADLKGYQEQKELIEKMTDGALKYAQTQSEVEHQLELEKTQLRELDESWAKELNTVKDIESAIQNNARNQQLVRQEIAKTNQQYEGARGLKQMGSEVDNVGEKVKKVLNNLKRWGLAIFGIRSAYMLVRQAMSTISQYDKQMATDIEYIRYALAMTLKPIIQWIIDGVYKILTYINYIANAWFGINLFKNAGVKEFNDGMGKANKQAKELKKTLAGFDEANILEDTSDKSESAGGGIPSLDLSKAKPIDIPDWVKWIAENKDLIIELAGIVGIAFGTAKTLQLLGNISKIFGIAGTAGKVGGSGLLGLGSSLASIVAIAGSIAIIGYVAYSTWQEIDKLKTEMQNVRNETDEMNKNWQKQLDPVKDLNKETNAIKTNIQSGRENLKKSNEIWHKENTKLGTMAHTWAGILGANREYYENAKAIAYRTDVTMETLDKMYKAEGRTKQEKKEIVKTLEEQRELNYDVIAQMNQEGEDTSYLKWVTQQLTNKIGEYNRELSTTNTKSSLLKDIWDKANSKMEEANKTLDNINNKEIKDKTFTIDGKTKIDTSALSTAIDKVIAINSGLVGKFMPSIWTNMLNQITSWRKKFGLATGGIVNIPGRGVPLATNVIGGESGREGVIPLTDPRAMSQLGKEIGQWVNLAIENKMVVDGRVLATATQDEINKENFLMNK